MINIEQQLHQVQQSLEQQYIEKKAIEAERSKLQRDLAELQAKIEQGDVSSPSSTVSDASDSDGAENYELVVKQLAQVQADLETYFILAKQHEVEISRLKSEIETLQKSNAHKAGEIDRKNEKLHTFSQKMKWLRSKVESREASIAELKAELSEKQSDSGQSKSSMNQASDELNQQNLALKEELSELRQQTKMLSEAITAMRSDERSQQQTERVHTELKSLSNTIKQGLQREALLETEVQSLREKHKVLQGDNLKLQAELAEALDAQKAAEQEAQTALASKEKLQLQTEALELELATSDKQLEELLRAVGSNNDTVKGLHNQLSETKQNAQQHEAELNEKLSVAERGLADNEDSLAAKDRIIADLESQLASATATRAKVEELEEAVQTLERRLKGKQNVIDRKDTKLHKFSQKLKDLEAKLKKAHESKQELQLDVSAAPEPTSQTKISQQRKGVRRASLTAIRKLARGKVKRGSSAEKQNVEVIRSSTLFNLTWYLQHYPDVAQSGIDAALHYLRFGGFEGRNPGPEFDSAFYLTHNPDVKIENVNPLLHYETFGRNEGRTPLP